MDIESSPSLGEAVALLAACGLPVADSSATGVLRLFGIRQGAALVAVVGLELHAPFGLLCKRLPRPLHDPGTGPA